MAKIPVKKDTKSDPVLDTLKSIEKQLISINGEVTNTSDTALRQNSHLKELVESLHTSTPAKVSKEKAVNPELEAIKITVEEERLQRLRDRNAADKKKDEDDAAARMVKLKSAEEDLKIKQIRLQTATQRLADMQEQAQNRARILAERAEQKLQADKKDPARNYGPVAALGRGVNAIRTNQPGTLSRAVTMALTGGIGNIFGLDKVLDATAGGIGKLAGNVIGTPFKALAKKRQEKKADKAAIRQAIHDAELQKRIQGELEARGLSESQNENSENTENVPTEKPKGRPKKNQKQTPGGTNLKGKSSGEAKKGSGTTADRKKNPMKGVETRLDKIDNTLKGMSKGGDKKKEEDKDTFFGKLLSMAGSVLSTLVKNAGSILLVAGAAYVAKKLKEYWEGFNSGMLTYWGYAKSKVGQFIKGVTSKAISGVKTLIGKVGSAANSLLSKVAPKVSNALSSIANTTKNAFNGLKSTLSKAITPIKNIGSKIGSALSKFSNTGVGKVVGKIGKVAGKGVKVFGKVLGPVMSLFETGSVLKDASTKGVTQSIKDYKKNWKWYDYLNLSKMAAVGGGWLGDKAGSWLFDKTEEERQAESFKRIAELRAKQNGTTVEQELTILNAQEANRKQRLAEKEAKNQTLNVKEDTLIRDGVAKQKDAEIGNVHENTAKEYEEMTKFTGAMHTWAENDDMYAVEINKDLFTNSGQLSEEGILILKRQGVTDQQMQQIQSTINNSTNNNGSNIYQTNITQHNDTGVYATGDAARTMAM